MPYIDHFLYTDVPVTKPTLLKASESIEEPHLPIEEDGRAWNKRRLEAIKLVLVNAVLNQHKDEGVFLYSRMNVSIPHQFNPVGVKHGAIKSAVDSLDSYGFIKHTKGQRKELHVKGVEENEEGRRYHPLSRFTLTPKLLQLAQNLGITKDTIKEHKRFHVRLRPEKRPDLVPFVHNDYTSHIELLMARYCYELNEYHIALPSNDSTSEDNLVYLNYGKDQEPIHLFRNYRTYTKKMGDEVVTSFAFSVLNDVEKEYKHNSYIFDKDFNKNFHFAGRSGGYWIGIKRELRPYIKIDGKPIDKADFPCSHINICYKFETGEWLQKETNSQLIADGRETEDAYYIPNVERDIVKQMVTTMFNVKQKNKASGSFNKWIKGEHEDETKNATPEEIELYEKSLKATGISEKDFQKWLIKQILLKHKRIKDYFLKGKLAGQVIQWTEANLIHHLAVYFMVTHGFPVLTVHDELIVPSDQKPMVAEQMFNSLSVHGCHVCEEHSLMAWIKNL